MIKSSIERLAESIGYDIGQSDDTVQSDLLNGFGNALANSMQPHALQTQLCYIADKLNPKAESIINELAEFIKLKNNKP